MIDGRQFVLAVDFPRDFEKAHENHILRVRISFLVPKGANTASNYSKEPSASQTSWSRKFCFDCFKEWSISWRSKTSCAWLSLKKASNLTMDALWCCQYPMLQDLLKMSDRDMTISNSEIQNQWVKFFKFLFYKLTYFPPTELMATCFGGMFWGYSGARSNCLCSGLIYLAKNYWDWS